MFKKILRLTPLRLALLTAPLLMASTVANAGLIITASLNGNTAVTVADGGAGDFASIDNSIVAVFDDGLDFITVTADSTSPLGNLNDTQLTLNLAAGATGSISVVDNTYEVDTDGDYIFSSLFNSANIPSTLDLSVQVFVNGIALINTPLVTSGTNVAGLQSISLLTGIPYTIQHAYSFTATGQVNNGSGNTFTQVPEPSVLALLGIGLLGLSFRKKLTKSS